MIVNIQRCSVHDGPGIRTTVFFKGCNMTCKWCHNPETISKDVEIILNLEKCIGCKQCEDGCYSGARTTCGELYTVNQLVSEIEQDKVYFGDVGGVTLSGGEAFLQDVYLYQLILKLKERGIKVAVETNFYHDFEKIKKFLELIDYWIIDFKIFNDTLHKKYTGVSNKLILENINLIALTEKKIIIRTPVIKGINDNEQELLKIAEEIKKIKGLIYYELLPYHPLGLSKNIENTKIVIEKYEAPEREEIEKIAIKIRDNYGIELRVAGQKI